MILKKLTKKLIEINVVIFFKVLNKIGIGRYILYKLSNKIVNEKKTIVIKNSKLLFYVPNETNRFRVNTFFTKEPDTLVWIDSFKEKSIFFDIGANIGLYSCYAAKNSKCDTYAFEPSFFNLRMLMKNVNVNKCEKLITIIANPLSDSDGVAEFKNGNTHEGGALSAFGVGYGVDGKDIDEAVSANVMGFTLDTLKNSELLKVNPNLIKIDVDGIEHLILNGAVEVLLSAECESILVEVNDDFKMQAKRVSENLNECGFSLREKKHGEMFDHGKYAAIYNQIWVK